MGGMGGAGGMGAGGKALSLGKPWVWLNLPLLFGSTAHESKWENPREFFNVFLSPLNHH